MKKKILCAFVLMLSLLLCACSQPDSNSNREDLFSALFHVPYIEASGIKVHHSSERKEMAEKIEKALSMEPLFIEEKQAGIFGSSYYGRVSNEMYLYYYGETTDNRPDGFGVLTNGRVSTEDYLSLRYIQYAGEFKDGRFHGYGAKFQLGVFTDVVASELLENGIIAEDVRSILDAYVITYVSYDGDWKDGAEDGKGNVFLMDKDTMSSAPLQENYWAGSFYPSVEVTEMKYGYENGKTKAYVHGVLIYDGETKDGERHGDGVSYYLNGQKEYDGKWKKDVFHGKGTLYDQEGNVIYSGKWENGDYAS